MRPSVEETATAMLEARAKLDATPHPAGEPAGAGGRVIKVNAKIQRQHRAWQLAARDYERAKDAFLMALAEHHPPDEVVAAAAMSVKDSS